jgi:hypothetical protein
VEVLPGKHWLKITPAQQLTIGEYALVEILSASDINQSVWDFRVDPQLGDNEGDRWGRSQFSDQIIGCNKSSQTSRGQHDSQNLA